MNRLNEMSNPNHYPSLADARDIVIKISRNIFGKFISWKLVSVTILIFIAYFVANRSISLFKNNLVFVGNGIYGACDVAITTLWSMAPAVKQDCFSLFKKAYQHILLTIYKTSHDSNLQILLLETGLYKRCKTATIKGNISLNRWKFGGNDTSCQWGSCVKINKQRMIL